MGIRLILIHAATGTLAVAALQPTATVAADVGSIGAAAANANFTFTLREPPEPNKGSDVINFTLKLPKDAFVESGTVILCDIGAVCTPADAGYSNWKADKVNWSDEIQFAGGTGGTFYSHSNDAAGGLFVDPNFGAGVVVVQEVGKEFVNARASYVANNPNGGTTTYTIYSTVPEPSAWAVMLLGIGGLGALARRRHRPRGLSAM